MKNLASADGVLPEASLTLGSAPQATNNSACDAFPVRQATCKQLVPFSLKVDLKNNQIDKTDIIEDDLLD